MEMWMWLVIAALTGVIGFILGRFMEGRSGRVKAMQEELESRKKELAQYRAEVSRHFSKTAALFSTLTGTYRNLYHHLADGCDRLAEMPAKTLFSGTTAVLEAKNEAPLETAADEHRTTEASSQTDSGAQSGEAEESARNDRAEHPDPAAEHPPEESDKLPVESGQEPAKDEPDAGSPPETKKPD